MIDKIVKWVRNHWTDPVWSKVFAGIILSILGGIVTLLVAAYKNIPIADLYERSTNSYLSISYFWLLITSVVFLTLLVSAYFQLQQIRKLKTVSDDTIIQSMFPGKWVNEYEFSDGRKGREPFEIRNGNEYHALGKLLFIIDSVYINKDKGKIKFRKTGLGYDDRRVPNVLRIVNENRYEGTEPNGTKVNYSRLE